MWCRSISPGMNPDRSASSAGRVAVAEQAGQRHHHPDAVCLGPSDQPGCMRSGRLVDAHRRVLRLAARRRRWVAGGCRAVRRCRGQCSRPPATPIRQSAPSRRVLIVSSLVVVGVVEGEPAEEQVGEQVGAALLVGAWIVGAEAAGRGGEHAVDGGGVLSRYFAGDIADAVGALHDGDSAFGQGAAMPLLERRAAPAAPPVAAATPGVVSAVLVCAASIGLLVDGGQGGGFGDPSGDPIDDPDLLGVQHRRAETLPRRWADRWRVGGCGRAGSAPGRAGRAAAATSSSATNSPGLGPLRVPPHRTRRHAAVSSAIRSIGVAHRRLGESSRGRCGVAARIRHRAGPVAVTLVTWYRLGHPPS